MAGQPPEPSFQPSAQDSGLTQGRPAWQAPPSYTPPAGSGGGTGGGQAYAASAPSYNPQDQPSYNPQDQGYQAHDQTQTNLGQGQSQDYPGYQGYQQGYQGYGAQQGQGAPTPPPQWSAIAGMQQVPSGRSKSQGDKGFIGSLFDFSFTSMVTPKIIRALYILFAAWTGLWALIFLGISIHYHNSWGTPFIFITLFIIDPIFILLTLGVYRVVLEAFMVVFRIYEETKKIRENAESQA